MALTFRPWQIPGKPGIKRVYVNGLLAGDKVWLEPGPNGSVIAKRQNDSKGSWEDKSLLDVVTAHLESAAMMAPGARLLFETVVNAIPGPKPDGRSTRRRAAHVRETRTPSGGGIGADDSDRRMDEAETRPLAKMQIPERVEIWVDHREPAELVEYLGEHPMADVRVATMELGDIGLNPIQIGDETRFQVLIERKDCTRAPSDFENSVTASDKRFFTQLSGMKLSDSIGILLLEGDVYRNSTGMQWLQQIDGALSYAAVIERISVIPTLSLRHSAYTILKVATHARSGLVTPVALRDAKPEKTRDRAAFVLEGLPGVNARLSRLLLDHFGSVMGVARATEAELRAVKGIGKLKAAEIVAVLSGEFGKSS